MNAIARPFGMLLMLLYDLVNNYGVAVLLTALVIKVILLPFQMKGKRGQIQQMRVQPKIAELQKKHGTNKAKLNEETMKLYKEEGVNPASGCIWGFLPLPILIAFFQVMRQPITVVMGVAEELVQDGGEIIEILRGIPGFNPESITSGNGQIHQAQLIADNFDLFRHIENLRQMDFSFLGIDLSVTPQWDFLWNADMSLYSSWLAGFVLFLVPIISGGAQFVATGISRKMNPQPALEGQAKSMNSIMMMMPLFSVYIGFIMPAALAFYWTISTLFQIVQDVWLTKVYTKKIEAEEAVRNEERRIKEEELEAKRLETERKKAEGTAERNPNTSKRKKQKSSKQGQIDKSAEWEKKNAPAVKEKKNEPGRVGNRRYARGRAYVADRYEGLSAISDEPVSTEGDGRMDAADTSDAAVVDSDITMIAGANNDESEATVVLKPEKDNDSEEDDGEYEGDDSDEFYGEYDEDENDEDEDYDEYDGEDSDEFYGEYDEDENDEDDAE